MSLLEDRLMRIIELRQQGCDDQVIAQRMELTPRLVQQYESTVKQAVERVFSGGLGDKVRLARRIGISPLVLELCLQCYFPKTTEGEAKVEATTNALTAQGIPRPTLNAAEEAVAAVEQKKEPEKRLELEQELPLKTTPNDNIVMLITRLRQQGVNTSSIAEQLHLPLRTVGRYEKQMSHLVRLINGSTQEEAGELESLRQELRISPFVVEWYLQQYRPEAPTKLYRSRRISPGTSLAQEKAWSESSSARYEIYQERNREKLEKIRLLAEEGRSLAEIGKEVGWSKPTVRKKIIQAGQYDSWRRKRTEPRQEQRELNRQRVQFCSFLRGPLSDQAAARQGWPYQKALEYERSRHPRGKYSIPLESLIRLFSTYEAASQQGKIHSYAQLARLSGIRSFSVVGKILQTVNVSSMYWNVEDKTGTISPEMRAKIRHASKVGLPAADISYFSGLHLHTVLHYRTRGQIGQPIRRFYHGQQEKAYLTYRLCSRIYEAEDLGFNRKETVELYDTTKEVVAYAFQHKTKLRKVMMDILEFFHPGEKIRKPYPVAKERKVLKG